VILFRLSLMREAAIVQERDLPRPDLARRAGVSEEAVALLRSAVVVDLHLETFIPPRLWGYDLHRSHAGLPPWGRFFGHLDLPRVHSSGLGVAMWSIATNILRGASGRAEVLQANVEALRASLLRDPRVAIVTTRGELEDARARGLHAALLAVQGGNAFEHRVEGGRVACTFVDPSRAITRVTVVHLSSSSLGGTSSPLRVGAPTGLSDAGRAMVRALDEARVFVDLAHVSEPGFWDALPALVTHTGMRSVHDVWRNIDDRQARAIADTGGCIGIIFHAAFLGPSWGPRRARDGRAVIAHLEAAIRAGGEHAAALGSDYDGFILPPAELRDGELAYARLVQHMLEARWSEERIRNVLGLNFLRSFERLRP
jgi:membrane dipeptidase